MSNIHELKETCGLAIKDNPELKASILEIYLMAADEISDGGSEDNEVELALSDLSELTKGTSMSLEPGL